MLEVSNIKKRYRRKNVLEHISFHAGCGESVTIVGRKDDTDADPGRRHPAE